MKPNQIWRLDLEHESFPNHNKRRWDMYLNEIGEGRVQAKSFGDLTKDEPLRELVKALKNKYGADALPDIRIRFAEGVFPRHSAELRTDLANGDIAFKTIEERFTATTP
jgi:hypothetical protein